MLMLQYYYYYHSLTHYKFCFDPEYCVVALIVNDRIIVWLDERITVYMYNV